MKEEGMVEKDASRDFLKSFPPHRFEDLGTTGIDERAEAVAVLREVRVEP